MSAGQPRILVLGGTGMLGHTLFELLSDRRDLEVHTTVRDPGPLERRSPPERRTRIHPGIDASRFDSIERVIADVRPTLLVNAIGIVSQVPASSDPVAMMEVNAQLPQRLAVLCENADVRLVLVSTDCVFSGAQGALHRG